MSERMSSFFFWSCVFISFSAREIASLGIFFFCSLFPWSLLSSLEHLARLRKVGWSECSDASLLVWCSLDTRVSPSSPLNGWLLLMRRSKIWPKWPLTLKGLKEIGRSFIAYVRSFTFICGRRRVLLFEVLKEWTLNNTSFFTLIYQSSAQVMTLSPLPSTFKTLCNITWDRLNYHRHNGQWEQWPDLCILQSIRPNQRGNCSA